MKVQLNKAQQKAVESDNPRILCLAGAGTGKTRVLTHRIAYLNQQRVGTSSMLALTFTRLAAKEMKERVMELIGESEGKKLFAGTFHGWCVWVLREYHHLHDRDLNFTIYGEEDRRSLIKSVNKDLGYDYSEDKVIEAMNNSKILYDSQDSNLLRVVQEYEYRMRQNNAFDLDMLLEHTQTLIIDHEEVQQDLKKRYKHIFVDEFQDTDDIQFSILKHLDPENLFVVGDDYQSIYAWRGANPQNIIDLSKNSNYEVVKLERNYRCTVQVCSAANTLIKHNTNRTNKEIITPKEGPEIICQTFEDEMQEAKEIGYTIANNIGDYYYSDFAVLARTNKQIDFIKETLSVMDIPTFVVSNKNDIFKKYHIRLILNWIETAINKEDSNHLKRVINFPENRISEMKLEELELKATEDSLSLYEVLEEEKPEGSKDFIEQLEKTWEAFHQGETLLSQINTIIKDMLNLQTIYKEKGLENRVKDIEEMYGEIHKWEAAQIKTGERRTIDAFLKWIRTKDIQDRLAQEEKEAVKLMTIHAAKGLEFPIVFVVGLNQGAFPHKRADIEEERRLFYVAVTRAKDRLVLTRPAEKVISGDVKKPQMPSQFLEELTVD